MASKELQGSMASEKSKDVRSTNITAAKAVADVVRTSLGPKGMDKMVSTALQLLILIMKLNIVYI